MPSLPLGTWQCQPWHSDTWCLWAEPWSQPLHLLQHHLDNCKYTRQPAPASTLSAWKPDPWMKAAVDKGGGQGSGGREASVLAHLDEMCSRLGGCREGVSPRVFLLNREQRQSFPEAGGRQDASDLAKPGNTLGVFPQISSHCLKSPHPGLKTGKSQNSLPGTCPCATAPACVGQHLQLTYLPNTAWVSFPLAPPPERDMPRVRKRGT